MSLRLFKLEGEMARQHDQKVMIQLNNYYFLCFYILIELVLVTHTTLLDQMRYRRRTSLVKWLRMARMNESLWVRGRSKNAPRMYKNPSFFRKWLLRAILTVILQRSVL